ncbi:uncharacterized protein LOC128996119 isoform X1 [Macrosteles quadrilineatus]|uniref:uncharacterized protein LOC128996119 isoform X1 n=1 Tax=Macrosteles quadrilineatus TaxID=74068 RepID=UPI0023E1CBA8|nr:uncharacterized protein LOC128996119 isoform X1 [Macrosteles quadrilineatus]
MAALTDDECQKIAEVLERDAEVRMREERRISLLRAVLTDSTAPTAASTASKICARCGRRLSVLTLGYGRRLQCAHCRLPVCRHCCTKTTTRRWLCVSCRKLRDVRLQSGEWFYQQLRQRFRSTVAAISNSDKNDSEVQEFMERLVEGIIGAGLDDVALYPLCDHPHYINFCEKYQNPLVQALRRLYANLKMALSDAVPKDAETACDLHAELKDLMKQMIQEARTHPPLSEDNGEASWCPPSGTSPESLGQRSYEDILATAILNKIFSKYQRDRPRRRQRLHEKTVDRNSNLLSTKLTATMQEAVGRTDSQSEDSDSLANSGEENSWSESSHHEPLSVTIEECIEEVTTRYSSDEEEPKTELDRFLSSLQYIKRQRAPFPEFGKDVVDGGMSSEEAEDESDGGEEGRTTADSIAVNPVDSWEENWLFQRRKLKTNVGTCQPVPVPMLVPHPTTDLRAMIGDVDADEMSDLSDCSDSVLEDLVDGPDDKKYFESQFEDESEEEKPIEVKEKEREVFLKYISDDLNKLIAPQHHRGMSPDTGQREEQGYDVEPKNEETQSADTDRSSDEVKSAVSVQSGSAGSPIETESSKSYSVAEARNISVPLVQVDSGEGSLDMQQEGEYTVAYATLAQVRSSPTPTPTPQPSPVPKPRSVKSTSTNSEITEDNEEESSTTEVQAKQVTGHDEIQDNETSSLLELSVPPKPGTIAEREHLKWEKAPPLANNPYSTENIARRQRQRMYLSRHSSSENSIEFPELTGSKEPSLLEIDSKHRRQDYNKYVRDYYVNVGEGVEVAKTKVPPRPASTEPRTPSHSCSQQQVSVKVEVEVAVSKNCSVSGAPTVTQTSAHHVSAVVTPDDQSYISLPSVRQLAKQFSTPDDKIPIPTSPVPVRKGPELRLHSPIRQVHSLTARNISREFRENLRGSTTVPVVKVVGEPDSSGHVSEDSGTVSPTPCPHPAPRRLKIQSDIQFWEQKRQR